jgi:hypothetical protein
MGLPNIATNRKFSRAAETLVQTASWAATVPPPFILLLQIAPSTRTLSAFPRGSLDETMRSMSKKLNADWKRTPEPTNHNGVS